MPVTRAFPLGRELGPGTAPLRLLDLFCGAGGWSQGFSSQGWACTGVDVKAYGYSGAHFLQADVLSLTPEFLDSFDAVVASPPCEEFARAWLPWLRGDHQPAAWAIELLDWSVQLASRLKCPVVVECSRFAARHVAGAVLVGSWAFWGDVPVLMPSPARRKEKLSGLHPELRALVPVEFSTWLASLWRSEIEARRINEQSEGGCVL